MTHTMKHCLTCYPFLIHYASRVMYAEYSVSAVSHDAATIPLTFRHFNFLVEHILHGLTKVYRVAILIWVPVLLKVALSSADYNPITYNTTLVIHIAIKHNLSKLACLLLNDSPLVYMYTYVHSCLALTCSRPSPSSRRLTSLIRRMI